MSSTPPTPPRRSSVLKRLLLGLLTAVLVLAFLEGLTSLGLLAYELFTGSRGAVAERRHTEYDADLGWVSVPGRAVPDIYGPGRGITINRQRFRNKKEFEETVPEDMTRIVCSGDSFTLGYGVDDDDTWPALLERRNPGLEVVNMGQGGYGLDQAYLWYERDGRRIEHQVHLFGITIHELERLQSDRFLGYGKPTLKLDRGRVVADSVPVPRRAFYVPWLTRNAEILRRTRIGQLFATLESRDDDEESEQMTLREVVQLGVQALRQVDEGDRAHGSRLVVVWLPVKREHRPSAWDAARTAMLDSLNRIGVSTLDLVPHFRRVPEDRAMTLFLGRGEIEYVDASGHYNAAGNRFVTERLEAYLRSRSLIGLDPAADRP